jgi:hypothetical protein
MNHKSMYERMALMRVLLQSTYDSNNFCECISHTQKPFKLKKQIKISFINERLADSYLLMNDEMMLNQKKCNPTSKIRF